MSDDLRRLSSLRRGRYGEVHEHHERLGSTNDRGLEWLRTGAPHGAVVTADEQDAGRGRRGRQWFSPPGRSLYVSLLLRPGPIRPPERFGALGLAVGVGLAEGLPPLRSEVALKWPNDLLVGGRKLGGILCEARWVGDAPEVVVGFGLNVHDPRFPPELSDLATAVAVHAVDEVTERAVVLAGLLVSLESAIEPFLREGFGAIRARYLARCVTLGRAVEVAGSPKADAVRRGVAERLGDDGALWVRPDGGGESFRVESSDVWLVPDASPG